MIIRKFYTTTVCQNDYMTHLECRGTAKVRKDEIESLSMQLLREKGQVFFFPSKNHVLYKLHQVSSLKYEVDTRKKTTKDLEGKLVSCQTRSSSREERNIYRVSQKT